jgi:hypothetical protein
MALILSLTKMSSESMIDAITDHLVRGSSEKVACAANGVIQQNFNKTLKSLNVIAGKVEAIKDLDWHHLTDVILKEDEDNEQGTTC